MQAEAADGNVDGRERAGDANEARVERDLFVRFTQRCMWVRLSGLDDTARQRHLTAVAPERTGANGEHKLRAIACIGKDQYEPCCVSNIIG